MTFPSVPNLASPSMMVSPMASFPSSSSDGSVMLSGSMNWEPVRQRLLGPDMNDALAAAKELREGIEIVHTVEFPLMLSALLPAFSTILAHRTNPSPDSSSVEHKLRNVVLEIISRMPTNEILRPHAPHLVAVALDILTRDFEENALLASRIIFDLYKVYRSLPQDHVQPYLDFVLKAYRSLPTSLQRNFLFNALATEAQPDSGKKKASITSPSQDSVKTNTSSDPMATDGATSTPGPTPSSTPSKGPTETPTTNTAPAPASTVMSSSQSTVPPSTPQAVLTKDPQVAEATPENAKAGETPNKTGYATPSAGTTPNTKLPTTPVPRMSLRSSASFRVLTECPLVVMLMFQLYPKFLRSNIPYLINTMMEALALRAPPLQSIVQGNQVLPPSGKRLYFSRCRDLVAAQAKTLSFLTYLLRGYSNELKPYEDRLASNVVALMSTCPREFISTRKELLVATRHLLNSEFRNGFYRHVDALLDERVLLGSHLRSSEQTVLRPLGYTTLSDLVHHARSKLSLGQISRVVSIFSRVLHDTSLTLPISAHCTAVKTLLNVVDAAYNNQDRNPQIGRDILVRVSMTLVDKLSALEDVLHFASVRAKESKASGKGNEHLISHLELPTGSERKETLRDIKSLVRSIVVGHKSLIFYIYNYRTNREQNKAETGIQPGSNEEVSSAMLKVTHTERKLLDGFIRHSFPCMKWIKEEEVGNENGSAWERHAVDQYRDLLGHFATCFTALDGYEIRRTLGGRLQDVVDAVTDDSTAIAFPRQLLTSNAATSFEFCSLLLSFLVDRMENLCLVDKGNGRAVFFPPTSDCDSNEMERMKKLSSKSNEADTDREARSTAYLQLFERVLKSLSVFPENERALRPYLRQIVTTCLRATMERSEFKVDNNCMLLRYVFRSISAGKFEESYRELLPLIPTVLNGLYRIFQGTDDMILHHTIIELLLTIPARLSSLLPHMNLLLRIIIAALESSSGDLVNLGLRTLEFWVDNLNPEFLFPELSKLTYLFIQLTRALSTHLRPAPYPYGLLTLRLLGKLGGKNRTVLREPMDVKLSGLYEKGMSEMRLPFQWAEAQPTGKAPFDINIPVERCVYVLTVLLGHPIELENDTGDAENLDSSPLSWGQSSKLWDVKIEETNFVPYCMDVIHKTHKSQAEAALLVLRTALGAIVWSSTSDTVSTHSDDAVSDVNRVGNDAFGDEDLELISFGLFLGCAIPSVQNESMTFAKGFMTEMFNIICKNETNFQRVDANGSPFSEDGEGTTLVKVGGLSMFEEGLGSLKPFGYFERCGPLRNLPNPLVVTRSIADMLVHDTLGAQRAGLELLRHFISLQLGDGPDLSKPLTLDCFGRGSLVFFESLLSALCKKCVSCKWNQRDGLYSGMKLLMTSLGREWTLRYEVEIMHCALISLKSVPRELSRASVMAFEFVMDSCRSLYGTLRGEKTFVDVLTHMNSGEGDKGLPGASSVNEPTLGSNAEKLGIPSDEVVQALITEMASTKHILRVASRFILKHYVLDAGTDEDNKRVFTGHLALIKRVLFSRSLRLLPLPEQVGAVEALTVIVQQLPHLIALDDQHMLAFLSELLKMSSVADGEMSDPNLAGSVVDKNGYAVPAHHPHPSSADTNSGRDPFFSCSVFLRRDCLLKIDSMDIHIPQELPNGVQLRVSSIYLLRAVIVGYADGFFDAETTTPIGNIRPHVISLLFRSLVSSPVKSVIAAHHALKDVLALSVVTEGGKSKSRLRKDLLQTCIRPVLLNLRDYSRLSVHLLRGLSRLLSLLSTWFNKTLGEKMLDHLQKWTDPSRLIAQKIWKEGEEPDVAASIIDSFVLLPHASQFVEPLVKTTIKLEACLPVFKSRHVQSPYRLPLARYLNKHCPHTVSFFFQRLKTPLYSNLFQDLIALPESGPLRDYLSSQQCSVSLLNVCLERPLAIIRSEKNVASPSPSSSVTKPSFRDLLGMHGIQPIRESPSQKGIWLKQEVETKRKKLQILQQELVRSKDHLQGKLASNAPATEIEDFRRKHKFAKSAFDRGTKELAESERMYSTEVQQTATPQVAPSDPNGSRPMTVEALELQLQGFILVQTLFVHNKGYLRDHNDVLRAFRWLWRSKGRYLRLQHEDAIPPRFHVESKLLAKILVDYSREFPNDVDLLFELIRIFLQPIPGDFSFVRTYLSEAVSNLTTEQKKQIMQKFFVLISGESTEEIKTLSVQLVVFPMLETSLQEKQDRPRNDVLSPGKAPPPPPSTANPADFIDEASARQFVQGVLLRDGQPAICEDKLKVELLKICNLLLEFVPSKMKGLGQEIFKFCWPLLKSEDAACRSWAYLVFSRHASCYPSTGKTILQGYGSLIRSHQQEGREVFRQALNLLVPTMERDLPYHECKKAIEYTNRVMFEEVNSIPQLAHIWQTIVDHPEFFASNQNQFVRYMINSLTRLGLPPNSPSESRALAVAVVELILKWHNSGSFPNGLLDSKNDGEEKVPDAVEHADKKRKLEGGLTLSVGKDRGTQLLDQNMVDTMTNFLVRMKILLADTKTEIGSSLSPRITPLLSTILTRWPRSRLRSVYLEKVVSMCKDYNASITGKSNDEAPTSKGKAPPKTRPGTSGSAKSDDSRLVSVSLLLACVDILSSISNAIPTNHFFRDNVPQVNEILAASFGFVHHKGEAELKRSLKQFVVGVLTKNRAGTPEAIVQRVKVLIEGFLVQASIELKNHSVASTQSTDSSRATGSRARSATHEGTPDASGNVLFAVDIIREVERSDANFVKTFTGSLLTLLSTIVRTHTSAASAKQKQVGVSYTPQAGTSNIRQMYHTPVSGILAESCSTDAVQVGLTSQQTRESLLAKESTEFDDMLRTGVIILDLLAKSDIVFTFSNTRKQLVQSLSTILDSSNSVHLLMAAVRIVGTWLSDASGRPLTVKERNSFLWKVASFDFNGISDVFAQPLVDMVSHYVINMISTRDNTDARKSTRKTLESDEIIVCRSLAACLLTANHQLRESLLILFAKVAPRVDPSSQFEPTDGIPVKNSPEMMWQLLHTDFEGLGGRDWVVLFVELFLNSLVPPNQNQATSGPDLVLRMGGSDPMPMNETGQMSFISTYRSTSETERASFLQGGKDFLRALRTLVHVDSALCRGLFQVLLPQAWYAVHNDNTRLKLLPPMESLLSRSFHSQFLKPGIMERGERPSNAVKSFLDGVRSLNPLPPFDTNLLISLAETYNCWYQVLLILETTFDVLRAKNLSMDGLERRNKVLLAIRHCYRQLGETNVWTSLALSDCSLRQSHRAASLAIHGQIDEALEVYTGLVELVDSGDGKVGDPEIDFIEDQWVSLSREQCQTDVVSEYARSSMNSTLLLESAWKQREWDHVRSLCSTPPLVAFVEAGDPTVKLCETLLAVADGKVSDVENLHAQTAQLCLYKWQLLPDMTSASSAHASLLHLFHRLVEIRESGQIMVETTTKSSGKTLPDLKNLLNAWRHRLPNDFDDLAMWDEVFTWRSHMFNAITSNFSWSEPSTLATLHDRPWTAIRMAVTARKHGMKQTSLLLLDRMTDSRTMGVSDIFLKLREQILLCNNPENELERTGGLNLINTTNLSFFDAGQKGELFRLKAILLSSLRRTSKSNQAYCHSVQICPSHTKAWVSWGGLCSSLGALTEKQAEHMGGKGDSHGNVKEARAASAKKVAQYMAQAMGCFLEAVQIDASSEKTRVHLAKCLWILTKDGDSPGVLCQTMESRSTKLPPWVWLPWIPQLLSGLCRIEGRAIKAILTRVVKAYPQAVYYSLRAFYLERRDVERAKGVPTNSSEHMLSVSFAEEMMSTLRRSHASLWSTLEAILEELIVKFRPSYEEELLATITALLERAESHVEKQGMPDQAMVEDEEAMVASWSKTLSRIAAKFFRSTDANAGSSRRDERVKKTADFKSKYKEEFESDFKVSAAEAQGPTSPDSKPQFKLDGYITRLQKWKRKLEAQVDRTPKCLPLVESSLSLAMFACDLPDMWPGACDTKYAMNTVDRLSETEDDNSRVQTTTSSAAIARKAAMSAALAAATAGAREGNGGEYGGGSATIEIPGQYSPNSATMADTKPCPELHAKLLRLEPTVEVLRRNDQLVRRVGMLGSDGKTYKFLLQFAIPYWTRADERTTQTNFVLDKLLRQNTVCARNHLSVQPTAAIPVAQRLRMTLDESTRVSLDEVLCSGQQLSEADLEHVPDIFLKEVAAILRSKISPQTNQKERLSLEVSARTEVFDEICRSRVDNRIFLRSLQKQMGDPESLFHFRRSFASQLAVNSLLQYVFSVAERTPQRFVVLRHNGQVLSPDFRVSYSNQGYITSQPIPFRMTPNVEELIGKSYLEGRFIRSFAMVADAVRANREDLDPILRLLMRDDILAWYSKSLAKSDGKTQELERQLFERISKNVSMLHARFSECAPSSTKASKDGPVDSKVVELYEAATNHTKLAMMPTNYHAWL
eukprot:Nitzschia sp. Nitz4//scaffold38_size140716//13247//26980//NITZ4_003128-RA/size140716-augustus-gene-0.132-mRNA-1//-1//CDS//3329550021//7572//frame0